MRNLIWIAVAVVVTGTVYLLFSGQSPREAITEAVDAVDVQAANEVAEDADEVEKAVETTAETVTEDSADVALESPSEVEETATEAAEVVTEEAETIADSASELWTVAGYDFDKVSEIIESSDLSAVQKTTLKTGLEQAKSNPELLQGALDAAKEALGL